jgi:hypothetical protein
MLKDGVSSEVSHLLFSKLGWHVICRALNPLSLARPRILRQVMTRHKSSVRAEYVSYLQTATCSSARYEREEITAQIVSHALSAVSPRDQETRNPSGLLLLSTGASFLNSSNV